MTDSPAPRSAYEEGVDLQRAERWADAIAAYRRALKEQLTVRLASNLGLCLSEVGDFEEALHWLRLAAINNPGNPDIRHRLGVAYSGQEKVQEAELEYRTALHLRPESPLTELALSALLLSVGRFREGWPLMEPRVAVHRRVVPPMAVNYPEWKGEPLAGRSIFVQVEQGLGDQIQMARFSRDLKARGAGKVTLGCRGPLAPLFLETPGVDATVAMDAGTKVSLERHDLWSRYFTLPWRLGTTLQDLWAGPYVFAPQDRLAKWKPDARVGLAWQANPTGYNGANKSLPPDVAQRFLDLGVISLQPEHTGVADMADTAAIVAGLDLVISIDTSIAHLAGAMGKPTWTLLPRLRTDWRWMRGRTDSPWYPSMRLYRQQAGGDWTPVVDRTIADLETFLTK